MSYRKPRRIIVNENNASKSRPDPLSFVAKMIFSLKVRGFIKTISLALIVRCYK